MTTTTTTAIRSSCRCWSSSSSSSSSPSPSSPFQRRCLLLPTFPSYLHHINRHHRRNYPSLFSRRVRFRLAAMSGPPRPPDRDVVEDESPPPEDLQMAMSRVQDGVQIFLAVLFWMTLFFWAGAWDGRDKGGSNRSS